MSEAKFLPAANEPNVVARFEWHDQLDVKASQAKDEHVYKKMIVCRTKIAGDVDENVLPVRDFNRDALIRRFPKAWEAFNGNEVKPEGTPLSEIGIDGDQATKFHINAVYGVEQLATLSDAICERIGFGTRKLREKAQQYLAARKAEADQAVLEAAASLQKPKRGRPAATEAA